MKLITVWSYDDLWDEGYRFDDIVTKRYCFVPREFAKNDHEALEFLCAAFKFIPKLDGTSKPLTDLDVITGRTLTLVINEALT